VSEYDREDSIMRRPWLTRYFCALGGKGEGVDENSIHRCLEIVIYEFYNYYKS
jgi:hypothetical protein